MITLEKIKSSTLEMLKSQETELLQTLHFVQRAKKLFQSRNGKPGRKRGPKPKARRTTAASAKPRKNIEVKKGTHLSNIMEVLRQKGKPLPSGEIVNTLFKQQRKDKSIAHYRQLIYPTLTQAYRRGVLRKKDGKVHLT